MIPAAEHGSPNVPGTVPREMNMGATHITVTIRNPADPDRAWEGLFLVDTGATDTLVPRPRLESIGLRPKGRRVYELAEGRRLTMEITTAEIEFLGETVGGTILFGEADAQPLLGATALESVGIEVDPSNQRLKRRPAVRLKTLREPLDHKQTEGATRHLEGHELLQRRAQPDGVTG